MIIEQQYRVKLSEIGKNNKITNKALLGMLEDSGSKHSDIAGYGILDIKKTNLTWVLLEWKVEIIRRPEYGENIIVKTWSRAIKKCYAYRDFEVVDLQGNIIAIASSKWILINLENGKIERVPEELHEKYEPESDKSVFENEEFEKLLETDESKKEITYKVRRADIDVNNHMHNLNYIELANEVLPNEIYEKEECNGIRITYKKEIKINDTVKVKYGIIDNKNIISIKSEDEKTLHSIIELK